jgi:hypothetical protein
VLASVTHHRGKHVLKTGVEAARLSLHENFSFFVTDEEAGEDAGLSESALDHDEDDPFEFAGSDTPNLFAFYAQDSIQFGRGVTVDFGVRADRSRMLAAASQWSPRLGAAYHLPNSGTIVRASVDRFFQPPQAENLLLGSSEEARTLSPFVDETGGGEDLEPERQWATELGVNHTFAAGMRFDVSYWRRRVDNAGDPNVLFGTTIIVPNAIARGEADGVDVRLELPRRRGVSGYLSYTNAKVVQYGPVTGGLFLEDEVIEIADGTAFTPDHDQRNVGAFGVTYDAPSGFWASFGGRYESGTPLEVDEDELDELVERPGAELVDFERGRVKPRMIFDCARRHALIPERGQCRQRPRRDPESHRRRVRLQLRQPVQRHSFRSRSHVSDWRAGAAGSRPTLTTKTRKPRKPRRHEGKSRRAVGVFVVQIPSSILSSVA